MTETVNIRNRTRRVKDLTLTAIEKILDKPESVNIEFYQQLLLKLAGNVIPRSQEITGEDGAALVIQISKEIADKNNLFVPDLNPIPAGTIVTAGTPGQVFTITNGMTDVV